MGTSPLADVVRQYELPGTGRYGLEGYWTLHGWYQSGCQHELRSIAVPSVWKFSKFLKSERTKPQVGRLYSVVRQISDRFTAGRFAAVL